MARPVEAIVMAAGEARRLRPISERFAKPVLPIDGRPVIATLLRELASAAIERAFVVTGHHAEQVELLVGDGSAFGLEVTFVRQPRADGSADAVRRALDGGATPPALITAADTQYTPGDVEQFVRFLENTDAVGAITARQGFVASVHKPGIRIEGTRVVSIYDLDPSLTLTSAPLWYIGPTLVPYLDGLSGPPYELKDAYQRAIDAGDLVAGLEIGRTRDLTHPVDLVEENFPYLGAL